MRLSLWRSVLWVVWILSQELGVCCCWMGIPTSLGCLKTRRTTTTTRLTATTTTNQDKDDGLSSSDIAKVLDMDLLLNHVSNYCGTYRGRQALLSSISGTTRATTRPRLWLDKTTTTTTTSRRRRALHASSSSSSGMLERFTNKKSIAQRQRYIAPLATSIDEARYEYRLVEEALTILLLEQQQQQQQQDDNSNDKNLETMVTHPPLYGALSSSSSPLKMETRVDTDYDEWMLATDTNQLTLEHVLHAEQVVKMLRGVLEWGDTLQQWAPGLASIASLIPDLDEVHNILSGAVEIVRQGTIRDPRGRSSYIFRLADSKFPQLAALRRKEAKLTKTIDSEMKTVLRKTKGSPEYVDFKDRNAILIPTSSVNPTKHVVLGAIEGRSYVEPRHLVILGDRLALVRKELAAMEKGLETDLLQTLLHNASPIDGALQTAARLDVLFAKAAFGMKWNGSIPLITADACVSVERFVHPVLLIQSPDTVVPTDLFLGQEEKALLISGPNGGGKTVAMKSFGLVTQLLRLSLPVPQAFPGGAAKRPTVGFFRNVLVEMGDQQNIVQGESTFMARLNAYSTLLERLEQNAAAPPPDNPQDNGSMLVLIDEMGGGTDPLAGGAIAQAILEKLISFESTCVVATTHSPRLKALSYNSKDFNCATVLLKKQEGTDLKVPMFQLTYGLIGDSYAIGAAQRATPRLPEDVLNRAASIMSSEQTSEAAADSSSGAVLQALTSSLEQQVEAAEKAKRQAETSAKEGEACRHGMRMLAGAYMKHFVEMETKLDGMLKELRESKADDMEVVGDTLASVRLAKKQVKTQEELLRDKGLKQVSDYYEFADGERVVIVAKGPWEGVTAAVYLDDALSKNEDQLVVFPLEASWDDSFFSPVDSAEPAFDKPLVLTRREVAIWDYNSVWEDEDSSEFDRVPSVRESQQRLGDLLSKLETSRVPRTSQKTSPSFSSARERKAARGGKKKKRK